MKKYFMNWKTVRSQFFTGISVSLPIFLSLYICWIILKILGRILFPVVDRFHVMQDKPVILVYVISTLALVIIIWVVGILAKNYFGRKLFRATENMVMRAPILNRIYESVRQVVRTIAVSRTSFKRVVLVEYPRKGVFSVAFVTNEIPGKKNKIALLIASTPSPTNGFYIIVDEEDTIPLDITVEDGIKLITSMGIVQPEDFSRKINKM